MSDVWEQQDGESPKAYAAFCVYRDMGPSRSVDAAVGRQEGGKRAAGVWWRLAAENDWKRRAEAYDAHRERQERRKRESEHSAELAAYRERARKAASAAAEIAIATLTKSGQRLATLKPEEIKPGMLPNFLRAAAAVLDTSLNAEAEAVGVRALEAMLDNADDAATQEDERTGGR